MPMFQGCKRDMVAGYEGGGDGQILDLDTAVKDGVLGGGGDQNPVAIFGVSKVLLPREIFGKNPITTPKLGSSAPPPEDALSPEGSPGAMDGQPSHLSSPPGFREDMQSNAAAGVCGSKFKSSIVAVFVCCIVFCI